MKLKQLLPKYLFKEAEGDETDNPFAPGGDDSTSSEEETDAGEEGGATDTADTEVGAEDGDAEAGDEQANKALQVRFNPTRVRKYNKPFKGSAGQVTAISKHGLTVSLEDGSTVLVNFDDIL